MEIKFNPTQEDDLKGIWGLLHGLYEYIPANPMEAKEERERLVNRISSLEKELTDAEEEIKVSKEKITNKDNEIDKLKKAIEENQEEYEKQIESLNGQIEELTKKISHYEPALSGEIKSGIFFKIEGDCLNETKLDDAPFVGKVGADGDAVYYFNEEKGTHIYYCNHLDELKNFCDIIDNEEGANHIVGAGWGTGVYKNGGLVIKSKTRIKLIKE